ncbi:MAG: OmpA family protein [Polyangiales bacterium]
MVRYLLSLAALIALAACGPQRFAGVSPIAIGAQPPPPPEPAPAQPRVEVVDNKIVIHEKIQFEFNKAIIREESFSLLQEIAQTIKNNPQIKKIRIEGHASSEGSDDYNLKLSTERAAAVLTHLVEKTGIDNAKLVSEGYGETKPIASNNNEVGREKNRRVEFTILEQDVTTERYEVDPNTGEKKLVEKQTSSQ